MLTENYIRESTRRTPGVMLTPGKIVITGRSIPDNPGEFFSPLLEKIIDQVSEFSGITQIDLGFEYINTTSAKWIFLILKKISGMVDVAQKASVTWYYEQGDDDMCELGFIMHSVIECAFLVSETGRMDDAFYRRLRSSE
ncbi:MAG TPA: SiaC family regulatory phosphoprotein [Bacteroidales bacterium]|nr:SiaC family regulatory phosphoprotein [Bacteroidales bacterium]